MTPSPLRCAKVCHTFLPRTGGAVPCPAATGVALACRAKRKGPYAPFRSCGSPAAVRVSHLLGEQLLLPLAGRQVRHLVALQALGDGGLYEVVHLFALVLRNPVELVPDLVG